MLASHPAPGGGDHPGGNEDGDQRVELGGEGLWCGVGGARDPGGNLLVHRLLRGTE